MTLALSRSECGFADMGNSEMAFTLPRPKRGFADRGNSENNGSYNIRRLKCGAN